MISKLNLEEVKKFSSVIIDQGLISITTFATTVIIARVLDADNYADYVLLMSIVLFILGTQRSLITQPFTILQNDYGLKDRVFYFSTTLLFTLVYTALILVLVPIFLYAFFDYSVLYENIIYMLFITGYCFYFFARDLLLSKRNTKANLYLGLSYTLSTWILLLIIYIYKIADLFVFLLGITFIFLTISSIFLFRNMRYLKSNLFKIKKHWKENFTVNKWLIGSNLFFNIGAQAYPWLLLYLTTKENVAVYGVLMSIASLINPVMTAFSSYLLPVFVQENKNMDSIMSLVKKWIIVFCLGALILVLIGLFAGQIIIDLFFGLNYTHIGFVVVLPFINQAINVALLPIKIALNAIKRTDVNFWLFGLRSIIAIPLGFVFITRFGIQGLFFAMILENILYQIFQFHFFKRLIK